MARQVSWDVKGATEVPGSIENFGRIGYFGKIGYLATIPGNRPGSLPGFAIDAFACLQLFGQ